MYDSEVYELIEEESLITIFKEFHIQIEIMLEEESFLEAFYLLKRMELLIEVI